MAQNTSSAVMQQRSEAHDSLDDFPTPPWATRALLVELGRRGINLGGSCREPAANRGHMVRPLQEYFREVEAADVHDYGAGFPVRDYLFGPLPDLVDWTITNPPYRLAEQFIDRMCATSRIGCAILVRSAFIEGVGRYRDLFSKKPPALMLQFVERVVMHKGKLAPDGSTATAYCWLVWLRDRRPETWRASMPCELGWIRPSRADLELHSDYEVAA